MVEAIFYLYCSFVHRVPMLSLLMSCISFSIWNVAPSCKKMKKGLGIDKYDYIWTFFEDKKHTLKLITLAFLGKYYGKYTKNVD